MSDLLTQLLAAVSAGSVVQRRREHINTGAPCLVFSRPNRVLWMPEDEGTEVVFQDGPDGEGQWWVASSEGDAWTVRRDYWDAEADASAEEAAFTGRRDDAVAVVIAQFLA